MDWWEIIATVLAYLGVLACVLAFLGGAAKLREREQDRQRAIPDMTNTPSTPALQDYPYELVHKGPGGCGKPAFYLNKVPEKYSQVLPTDAVGLDGTWPEKGEVICCGSCGRRLYQACLETEYIRKREETPVSPSA